MEKVTHLVDWLTDGEFRFASKITANNDRILHDHSFYELFYVTKGHMKYQINGEPETTLQTGDLCFIDIKDRHIFLREPSDVCEHRDIVIRPELFAEICSAISENFLSRLKNGEIAKTVNVSANRIKEFELKCGLIDQLMISNKEDAKTEINLFCYELLGCFFSQSLSENENKAPNWVKELMERFNDVSLLKAGISEIIKPFYFTNEHICRVFKKYNGMTMTDYLNQRRIFECANMLIYTNMSIAEIYDALGINSISYFNKLFKKQYHSTPLQFRKQKEII